MAEFVTVDRDGDIAVLKLNRPEAFNAFNLDVVKNMGNHLTRLSMDTSVRCVIVIGEGKAFCAGGDLKWAQGHSGGMPAAFHELASRFHLATVEIRRMKKPVIAAVNGVAAGAGFSLAMACDFRVMVKSAIFRQAYTSAGLCIDGGGTFTLPRLVGIARALEIAAFDKPISAEQALEWGLVTKVVNDGKALEEAMVMAKDLADRSIHSFGLSKELINDSFNTSFERQLERERDGLCTCADHKDGIEGIDAFTNKRKPVFNPK